VIEADEGEMLALMRRWIADEFNPRPDEADQLVDSALREGRAWNECRLGIRGRDGSLASMTKLRSDGRTAQVEDVYTAPDAREQGFARTLVCHATELARAAGHELLFIIADDDNWPKRLYSRLGYEPIGRAWAFHRDGSLGA
jgi:GNAT superfamily N-acetyltransferase